MTIWPSGLDYARADGDVRQALLASVIDCCEQAADRIEELEAKLAQQDDLVQAAVAAALREAAEVLIASADARMR